MDYTERSRITFDVDFGVKQELMKVLPRGTLSPVYRELTMSLIAALKDRNSREAVMGAIFAGRIGVHEIFGLNRENSDESTQAP